MKTTVEKYYRDPPMFESDLTGLARQCPTCRLIAHYEVRGRKEHTVSCPNCGTEFTVQKYRKGERPKAINHGGRYADEARQ